MQEEPADRLKRARIAAGYASAAEASRAHGWDQFIYRSHESGRRKFDADWALRYGAALHVTPEWLLLGKGAPKWARVAIVSFVGAGAQISPVEDRLEEIEPPAGCPENAFGVIVRGDSMYPAFEDGDVLICAWTDNLRDVMRRRAVVDTEDGDRLLKLVEPGPSPETVTLMSISSGSPPRTGVRLIRAARILYIIPR